MHSETHLVIQSGIGTYTIPQVATHLASKFMKTLDLMFANQLNYHVMSGYHFLMQNCECSSLFAGNAIPAAEVANSVKKRRRRAALPFPLWVDSSADASTLQTRKATKYAFLGSREVLTRCVAFIPSFQLVRLM